MTYYNRDNLFNLQPIPRGIQGNSGSQGPTGLNANDWVPFSSNQYLNTTTLNFISIENYISPVITNTYYQGGCLASNGKIYMIPGTGNGDTYFPVIVIHPDGNTLSTISRVGYTGGWRGGVYAKNNKIYCAPSNSLDILVINTENDTINTIPVPQPIYVQSTTFDLYWGAAYSDEKVIFIPFNAYQFLVIDINVNGNTAFYPIGLAPPNPLPPIPGGLTTTYYVVPIGTTSPWTGNQPGNNWAGGVLGVDGNIYTIPHNRTDGSAILRINPYNLTYNVAINSVASGGEFFLFAGGALHPNGEIYFIPRYGINKTRRIAKLGPAGVYNTLTQISSGDTRITTSFNTLFYGGICSPSGSIYCIPGGSSFIKEIDSNGVVNDLINVYPLFLEYFGVNNNNRLWFGGVLDKNSKLYLIPWSYPKIGVLNTGLPKYPNWMLDPYFNKF
jgi:hypothetical protein